MNTNEEGYALNPDGSCNIKPEWIKKYLENIPFPVSGIIKEILENIPANVIFGNLDFALLVYGTDVLLKYDFIRALVNAQEGMEEDAIEIAKEIIVYNIQQLMK